jgi:O-succinylbenzoate synthase
MVVVLEASSLSSSLGLLRLMRRACWFAGGVLPLLLTLCGAGEEEGMVVVLEASSPSSLLFLLQMRRRAWWLCWRPSPPPPYTACCG